MPPVHLSSGQNGCIHGDASGHTGPARHLLEAFDRLRPKRREPMSKSTANNCCTGSPRNKAGRASVRTRMTATLLEWVFAPQCVLCGADPGVPGSLCRECRHSLPRNHHCCSRCALPLTSTAVSSECGHCQRQPPPFDCARVPYVYAAPIDTLITRLKFREQLYLAPVLAALLLDSVSHHPLPDIIIPTPLHDRRSRARGFNQTLEIARWLGQALSIPVAPRGLTRIRHTPAQTGLGVDQRRRNLHGAFVANQNNHWSHVALLDDVVTSAATVSAAATALRAGPVKRLEVWAIARTAP